MTEHDDPPKDIPRNERRAGNDDDDETNWTGEVHPLVGADFVDDTLARVLEDRSEIEAEAARVEQIQFEQKVLDTYPVPEPAADFVEVTLSRVMAARSAGLTLQSEEDFELRALIEGSHLPLPSEDFVERTVQAVMTQGRSEKVGTAAPRRFSFVAAVAAILLCAIVIFWDSTFGNPTRGDSGPQPQPAPTMFAPVAFGSLVTESDAEATFAMPIRIGSTIARLAAAAKNNEEGR